ncbi:tRNA lysidine(34) synthetase TilS [Mangrovibacillus cuniculi]|uniref:tRNA(Ile)-lysidine synthase n=1 Tax=Mangrovibacillus cuniculi TaxID=2593652 RepID=A0A7S8HGW5_9BACI|nr:tRNA lysidine(34) synthetase TilS [Mangrovibacillus cuniculi]QPC47991.1 tRNA lysidine(34) synthetase TilS [Mangrovibacillus cuniculi]
MSLLWHQINKTNKEYNLFSSEDSILLAVSGGIDSMVLLHFFYQHRTQFGVTLSVAHVNHQLRDVEAEKDYLLVEKVCREYDIPFYGTSIPVGQLKLEEPGSTQMVARKYRYEFLYQTMKKTNCNVLMTAHHADDQLETLLQKITRGVTNLADAGIPVKRSFHEYLLVRPLINVRKDEIKDYASLRGVSYREDSSNESTDYQRNKYRHLVTPVLKEENPQIHTVVQRLLNEAVEDEEYLQKEAKRSLEVMTRRSADQIVLDNSLFYQLAMPLQRRVIQLILNYLYIDQPFVMHSKHVANILQLIHKPHPSGEIHLPENWSARKETNNTRFKRRGIRMNSSDSQLQSLPFDQVVKWNNDRSFLLTNTSPTSIPVPFHSFIKIYLSHEDKLYIRSRRPGDRLQVKGLTGHKKVKSLMIDKKIPQHKRDEWPLLVTQDDTVLWVPGIQHGLQEERASLSESVAYVYELKE